MPTISFFAGENFSIDNISNSGLGFFGDNGFGASVLVGNFNGRTFITNGAGTTQGAEVDNIKYHDAGSGILGQTGSGIGLKAIPNYQGTLNLRFTHTSAVQTQNVKVRAYDRTNINNLASGVTVRMAELIHPGITQVPLGSGDDAWVGSTANPQTGGLTMGGSGLVLTLANSPGTSGLFAGNGSNSTKTDTQHDWYLAISCSPDSVGSKTQFGLYVELEYL